MAKKEKRGNDLGRDPVGTLMLRLALPSVVAQLVNALYNIVDRIYIGRIPGEGAAALTGLGICFPVTMLISALASLVGVGGGARRHFNGRGQSRTGRAHPRLMYDGARCHRAGGNGRIRAYPAADADALSAAAKTQSAMRRST